MFKEYDVVRAKRDLNDKVKLGDIGTILMIFDSKPSHYEVEFCKGIITLDILTVSELDLESVNNQ